MIWRRTIQRIWRAGYRTAAPKKVEYIPSEFVKEKPGLFLGVHTPYGWFVVPKEFWAPRWTSLQIIKALESLFPNIKTEKPSHLQMQHAIDDWGQSVDINSKPEMNKPTRAELKQQRERALYRQQLRDDLDGVAETTDKPEAKSSRQGMKLEGVTFIHAWNYFFSLMHPKYRHLPVKESRKEISNIWNSLTGEQKEDYREEYANLLSEGKDVYRGQIVTREEKLKRSPKKKTQQYRS